MDARLYILGGLLLLFIVLLGYLFVALGAYLRAVRHRRITEDGSEIQEPVGIILPREGSDVFTQADAGESIFGAPLRTSAWQPEEPQGTSTPAEPDARSVPDVQPAMAATSSEQANAVESILLTLAEPHASAPAAEEVVTSLDATIPEMAPTAVELDEASVTAGPAEHDEVSDLIAAYGLGGVWSASSSEPVPAPEIPAPMPEPEPAPMPEPEPAPMPPVMESRLPTGQVLSAASGMASSERAVIASENEYHMVAPVELAFTVGEARVGVKPGTRTYAEFQRLAAVLLDDLHVARRQPPQG
ncbi:MAG: hypothetical protein WBI63_06255 [Coriobacteriia bacterium]